MRLMIELIYQYMGYLIEHWASMKTTNLIDRLHAGPKRGIDVIRIFPIMDAALRPTDCLYMAQHGKWISTRKILNGTVI